MMVGFLNTYIKFNAQEEANIKLIELVWWYSTKKKILILYRPVMIIDVWSKDNYMFSSQNLINFDIQKKSHLSKQIINYH